MTHKISGTTDLKASARPKASTPTERLDGLASRLPRLGEAKNDLLELIDLAKKRNVQLNEHNVRAVEIVFSDPPEGTRRWNFEGVSAYSLLNVLLSVPLTPERVEVIEVLARANPKKSEAYWLQYALGTACHRPIVKERIPEAASFIERSWRTHLGSMSPQETFAEILAGKDYVLPLRDSYVKAAGSFLAPLGPVLRDVGEIGGFCVTVGSAASLVGGILSLNPALALAGGAGLLVGSTVHGLATDRN